MRHPGTLTNTLPPISESSAGGDGSSVSFLLTAAFPPQINVGSPKAQISSTQARLCGQKEDRGGGEAKKKCGLEVLERESHARRSAP